MTATRTPSPLDAIVHEAGRKLQGLQMTRIAGNYADKSDADNLRADLEALWGIVDPLILAIGQYAGEHFNISAKSIKDHFTDQLRGALEGNSTFVLEQAGDEAQEALTDNAHSDFSEHGTLNRAMQGV